MSDMKAVISSNMKETTLRVGARDLTAELPIRSIGFHSQPGELPRLFIDCMMVTAETSLDPMAVVAALRREADDIEQNVRRLAARLAAEDVGQKVDATKAGGVTDEQEDGANGPADRPDASTSGLNDNGDAV